MYKMKSYCLKCRKDTENIDPKDSGSNKFLLAGDKFMPEMHLKQPGFTQSACGPFTKNKEIIQKFKEQEIQAIFTKMNLIRLAFNLISLWRF